MRPGGLADHMTGFGRALRRAGVPVDMARIALAQQAVGLVGPERKDDFSAALEAVMVSREQDIAVFRALFAAWFRAPDLAGGSIMAPPPGGHDRARTTPAQRRASRALAPSGPPPAATTGADEDEALALTASRLHRLRHADFRLLDAAEYPVVERLARQIELPVPHMASRRSRPGARGSRPHWGAMLRQAHRTGGELLHLPRLARRVEPLPLLILADVSGSMARYARLLLAFLHAAGGRLKGRRDVFAFGTQLTDLTPAFRLADTDEMLAAANEAVTDFGGGTRLGESLAMLRQRHARRLVGGRTVVLLISDGLDTGEPDMLARELAWLRLHSRRLLWLNPLLRFDGYEPVARGAAVLHRHAHGMLAVHNLGTLEQLAAGLAAVMKH